MDLADILVLIALGLAFVYTALVSLFPYPMIKIVSIPFVDSIQYQFGTDSLEFQCTTETVYHHKCFARTIHSLTVVIDSLCWWVLVQGISAPVDPALGACIYGAFLAAQAISFGMGAEGNLVFAGGLLLCQGLTYAAVFLLERYLIALEDIYLYAAIAIFATALIRVASHSSEALPPYLMGSDSTNFEGESAGAITMRRICSDCDCIAIPQLALITFCGLMGEVQNGMAFRALPILTYFSLRSISTSLANFPWSEKLCDNSNAITKGGLLEWDGTRELYAGYSQKQVEKEPLTPRHNV